MPATMLLGRPHELRLEAAARNVPYLVVEATPHEITFPIPSEAEGVPAATGSKL